MRSSTGIGIGISIERLNEFLRQNETVDFRTADLLHSPNLEQYAWQGFEQDKEALKSTLKAYQRMLRIVPEGGEEIAKTLLKQGVISSFQITNTSKKDFIQRNFSLFEGHSESRNEAATPQLLAEQTYLRAIALRNAVTLQYAKQVQRSQPSARAAKLTR